MNEWTDEDIATVEYINEYLVQFREGITKNPEFVLNEIEKSRVEHSLNATEEFCKNMLLVKNRKLYMHDLILMAIGFYGGHLTALEGKSSKS
jgi:hypothetical protein